MWTLGYTPQTAAHDRFAQAAYLATSLFHPAITLCEHLKLLQEGCIRISLLFDLIKVRIDE